MQVLVDKLSSMGDILHTLPALSDAYQAYPNLKFDWLIEPAFAAIPRWHGAVKQVLPLPLRQWRKTGWCQAAYRGEIQSYLQALRQRHYDLIIDAQGLLKSAMVACYAKGPTVGLNWRSAREPLASIFYRQSMVVSQNQHAITRVRSLFAQALAYPLPESLPNYGVQRENLGPLPQPRAPYVVFLHSTTWASKHWPEVYWVNLAQKVTGQGYQLYLPWGNALEKARAQRIATQLNHKVANTAIVLEKLSLSDLAKVLIQAQAVVALDTGLGHLCAALGVPTLSLYGATNPKLTGTYGPNQQHLVVDFACAPCLAKDCALVHSATEPKIQPPCYTTLSPAKVWQVLAGILFPTSQL